MERRKFLVGIGSLAAGGAAAMGTGAVSSITAEREIDLRIAQDRNAYLGLDAGPNDYVSNTAGTQATFGGEDDGTEGDGVKNPKLLTFDFSENNGDVEGAGVNNKADTVLEDAFTIKNQSDRTLYVWIASGADPTTPGAQSLEMIAEKNGNDLTFPDGASKDDVSVVLEPASGGVVQLAQGESTDVKIRFLVSGSGSARSYFGVPLYFRADEDYPGSDDDWEVSSPSSSS